MPAHLTILTGPAGAGKTTVTRLVCERLLQAANGPVVDIEVDDLRHMVLGDRSETGNEIWLSMLEAMLERAIPISSFIVVEGLFFFQYQWQRIHHRYPNVKMIQLQPSLDACLERNRTRMHKAEIIPDEEVRRLYEITRGGTWEIVDANPSIERVAAEIYRKVVDGAR